MKRTHVRFDYEVNIACGVNWDGNSVNYVHPNAPYHQRVPKRKNHHLCWMYPKRCDDINKSDMEYRICLDSSVQPFIQKKEWFTYRPETNWSESVYYERPSPCTYIRRNRAHICVGWTWGNIWKKVCPSQQYLNGKKDVNIISPKNIADDHEAEFANNSSYALYSERFSPSRSKIGINVTSDNIDIYKKSFKLRNLRRSTMGA